MCFFAKTLNLPEKVAKEELAKARNFCREDLSDSDDSAWFGEIDDSSDISVSLDSRATSSTAGSKLDSNLRSPLPETQPSLNHKAPKKRKLEQADAGDDQARQTIMKFRKTRHAQKAKAQGSEASDRDQVMPVTQASTSSAKKPNLMMENEVSKPRKKRKRNKKVAKAQRRDEVIKQADLGFPTKTQDSPSNTRPTGREEKLNIDPSRSNETIEPRPENTSDKPVELSRDEGTVRSDQELRVNGVQQPPGMNEILKLQRKNAKKARRRGVREVNSVKIKHEAKPPVSQLSPDEKDPQAVTILRTEQDLHTPQDFHSPMIQCV